MALSFLRQTAISVVGADEALVAGDDSGAHCPVVVVDKAKLKDEIIGLLILDVHNVDEFLGVGRQHSNAIADAESSLGQPIFKDAQSVVMLDRCMNSALRSVENLAERIKLLLILEDRPMSAIDDSSGFEKRSEVVIADGGCDVVHFCFPFFLVRYLIYYTLFASVVKYSNLVALGVFDRCGRDARLGKQLGEPSAGFLEFNLGFDVVGKKSEAGS